MAPYSKRGAVLLHMPFLDVLTEMNITGNSGGIEREAYSFFFKLSSKAFKAFIQLNQKMCFLLPYAKWQKGGGFIYYNTQQMNGNGMGKRELRGGKGTLAGGLPSFIIET